MLLGTRPPSATWVIVDPSLACVWRPWLPVRSPAPTAVAPLHPPRPSTLPPARPPALPPPSPQALFPPPDDTHAVVGLELYGRALPYDLYDNKQYGYDWRKVERRPLVLTDRTK